MMRARIRLLGCWVTSHLLTRRLKANSEFRKRYRYNIAMRHQFSDAMCDSPYTKRRKQHHEDAESTRKANTANVPTKGSGDCV